MNSKDNKDLNRKSDTSNSCPLVIQSIGCGNVARVKEIVDEGFFLTKEMIEKHNCIMYACKIGDFRLFDFLIEYGPFISNPEACFEEVVQASADHFRSYKKKRMKKAESCIKIASVFIERFGVDV